MGSFVLNFVLFSKCLLMCSFSISHGYLFAITGTWSAKSIIVSCFLLCTEACCVLALMTHFPFFVVISLPEHLRCNSCSTITRFPRYNDPLKVLMLCQLTSLCFTYPSVLCYSLLHFSLCSSWKPERVVVGSGLIALLSIVVLLAMNLVW